MRLPVRRLLFTGVGAFATVAQAADAPQGIPVVTLGSAPSVDGNLAEWGKDGWLKVKLTPAVPKEDREKFGLDPQDRNLTGTLTVDLKAGVAQGRIYLAARWPDDAADTEYKGWEWNGTKYVEGKRRDDMFALRFHKDGLFDRSMLSGKNYKVDVWLWSAGRTNPSGYAEDWEHRISTAIIENAAEYEVKGVGTVFIKKDRDAGEPIYKMLPRPKVKGVERAPAFETSRTPSGSVADVTAKARWSGGYWNLELSRKLDTGYGDDVELKAGLKLLGQVAVFNRGADENKSVSDPLLFDFSAIK